MSNLKNDYLGDLGLLFLVLLPTKCMAIEYNLVLRIFQRQQKTGICHAEGGGEGAIGVQI